MREKNNNKSFAYTLIYQFSLILISIVLIPYTSRVLGKEGVGMHSFSYVINSYFVLLGSLSFYFFGKREIAKHEGDTYQQSKVFWEIIFCRLVTVLLAITVNLSLYFSGVYGKYSFLMLLFTLDIVSIALDISFFFHGKNEYGKVILISLICKVLIVVCIFTFVKTPQDVWLYVLFYGFFGFINIIFMWFFLRKKLAKVKIKDIKPLRHLKGAFVLCIPSLIFGIYNLLDNTLIGVVTQSDIQNGFYAQSEKIVTKCSAVVGCLNYVMIVTNIKASYSGDRNQVKENIYKIIRFVWFLSIPMTFGLILSANNFVPWFLSADFSGSILLLQIMSLKIPLSSVIMIIAEQFLLSNKQDKKYVFVFLSGAVVSFIINIPLIYNWGALGTAISSVIVDITMLTILLCLVAKELSLKQIFAPMIKPLIAGLVMCLVIYPLCTLLAPRIINTLIIITVGIITYLLASLILRNQFLLQCLNAIFKKKKK